MMMLEEHDLSNRKVLIIPEYGKYGGTFSFLRRLIEIHKKNGIETAVLIEQKQRIPEVMSFLADKGIFVYTSCNRKRIFFNPFLSPLFDIFFVLKAVFKFRPDLIVVSNGSYGIMSGVLFLSTPVLFIMHGYPTEPFWFPLRLMWSFASGLKNHFISVSKFAAEKICSYMSVPPERIEVIHNSTRVLKCNALGKKESLILTVGHVIWYKNPEIWLEVAKKVLQQRPEVKFTWLGDGEALEKMRKEVFLEDLGEKVVFAGYSDEVASYYEKALLYFQPSLIENNSIAVIEAMAQGLPCVSSDVGGLPESVIDGKTGFTCPVDDADTFADRIVYLIDDEKMRKVMGRAGRWRCEAFFSEARQEEAILTHYKKLSS